MADIAPPAAVAQPRPGLHDFALRLAGSRRFQALCARIPGLRAIARAEGAALFDLMQGFVQSQMLLALVELDVFETLAPGPLGLDALAARAKVPPARMRVLVQAGVAMGLLRRARGGYGLARRGAAFRAVPGLAEMVRHHRVLYADLADPVAVLRGETSPELARFWPYVFGAEGARAPDVAARYSRLMADSQALVAEDALPHLPLRGARCLMDVGGGTGAFLRAVRARAPHLDLALFDLPAVVAEAPLPAHVARHAGSFRDDPLPACADLITLVRVLYDHSDDTVAALLRKVHAALPPGGKLAVIEPMSGGARPDPQTDVYFSVYTLAMETGRTRSANEITALLRAAGFDAITGPYGYRPYVTSVLLARKPQEGAMGAEKSVNKG